MVKKQLKRNLLSAALAASVAGVPIAASAAEINPYFRLHSALQFLDNDPLVGDDTTWDLTDVASRFGMKGRHDLDGGGYARAHLEVGVDAADSGVLSGADEGGRVAVIAVGGDWGELKLGRDYNPLYNATAGATTDPWYGISAPWYSGGGESRKGGSVTYSRSVGAINFEVAAYIDEDQGPTGTPNEETIDETRIGVSGTVGSIYWGVGAGTAEESATGTLESESKVAGSIMWTGDNVSLAATILTCSDCAGVLNEDIDTTSFVFNWTVNDTVYLTVGVGTNEIDSTGPDRDIDKVLFGLYKNLNKDVIVYTEIESRDNDFATPTAGDSTMDARFGLIVNVR